MKKLGAIFSILFGYIFIGFFAYGFIGLLKSYNASIYLLLIEGILYLFCAVIYTILSVYLNKHKKENGNMVFENKKKSLTGLFLVSFLVPIIPVVGKQIVSEHSTIFFIAFMIIIVASIIPTSIKLFNRKISYWDARIIVTKRTLIALLIMILTYYICEYLQLPIVNWRI